LRAPESVKGIRRGSLAASDHARELKFAVEWRNCAEESGAALSSSTEMKFQKGICRVTPWRVGDSRQNQPQRLKPYLFGGFCGMTEVMP
jgi:hypothetical protein